MAAISKNFNPDAIPFAGENGLVVVAPKGTAAPADATADWPTGWASIGLLGTDGIGSNYTRNSDKLTAFNVRGAVKTKGKTAEQQLKFTALQWDAVTLPLFFGTAGQALATSGHSRYNLPAMSDTTEYAWGVHLIDAVDDSIVYRLIIPRGTVDETGETTWSEDDTPELDMTVGGLVSAGVDYIGYWMSNHPAWVPAA